MNRAAHNYETGVQCILEALSVLLVKEPSRVPDDHVVNALLLSFVIDTHVAEDAQAQLTEHAIILRSQAIHGELSGEKHCKLMNSALSKQRLDAVVVERQVHKGLKQEDEVGAACLLNIVLLAVLDEACNHLVGSSGVSDSLTSVGIQ